MEVEITPFDNRYSLLYKLAARYNTLARLILVKGEPEQLESYVPLYRALEETLALRPNDLLYAYSVLLPLSLVGMEFSSTDLVMTYVNLVGEEVDLKAINLLLEQEGLASVSNQEELPFLLSTWKEAYAIQERKDRDYLNYLLDLQAVFAEIEPLPRSPLEINKVTLRSSLVFSSKLEAAVAYNGVSPLGDLAEEIFDQTEVSVEVPLVIFTDSNGRTLSKVWNGFTIKSLLPSTPPTRNSFYLLVWTGSRGNKVTKESYTIGRIDLTIAELTIDIPISNTGRGEEIVLERIREALPIDYEKVSLAKLGGEFRIYDFKIAETLFLDMLVTIQYFYSYLFMPEEGKAAFEKKKLSLHMRATPVTANISALPTQSTLFSSISSSLNQYVSDGAPVLVETLQGAQLEEFPSGTPFITASITRANSALDARQYIEILSRVMRLYLQEKDAVEEDYKEIFPEATYNIKVKSTKRKVSLDAGLFQLQQAAPDIFIKGYARKCQKGHQPIVVPNSQVEEWESSTFRLRGVEHHRQVMTYPPNNPKINVVCPTDKKPFPGVKKNSLIRNRDLYPYIPCCFGSNQMKPGKRSDYNFYYHGLAKKEVNYVKKGRILTSKVLGYKRSGILPIGLSNFLSSFYSKETDFVRIGVPRDTNSAISAVILALQGLETKLKESSLAELANKKRKEFDVYPELLKQELYDLSNEEILAQLHNEEIFFDPLLFYRALEETYQVNILSFVVEGSPGREVAYMETPRHAYYHAQPFRERPLVLLYRNYGSESDALVYPQIELIANIKQKKPLLFESPFNQNFFLASTVFSTVYVWEPKNSYLSTQLAYQDYLSPLNLHPQAQYLDEFGKLRGIISQEGLVVFFPPSAPLNLPLATERRGNELSEITNLIQQKPSAGYYEGGQIKGLWFSTTVYPYTYFFPLNKPYPGTLPRGPPNPFPPSSGKGEMEDYAQVIQKRNLILQLISWFLLLSLSRLDVEQPLNQSTSSWAKTVLDWFRENFLLIGEEEKSNYSFPVVSRLFPSVTDLDQAKEFLSTFPGLMKEGKIYLYNQRFAQGVLYFLKGILESYPKDKLLLPREIYGLAFRKRPLTFLFESWEELLRWEREVDLSAFLTVYAALEEKFSHRGEPFFFRDEILYLIQNAPDLPTAVSIALTWRKERVNLGIRAKKVSTQVPTRVYRIATGGKLEIKEESPGEEFVNILDYGNGVYGAMLPLSQALL